MVRDFAMIVIVTGPGSGGGGSLPLKTVSDPSDVILDAAGHTILETDFAGNPALVSVASGFFGFGDLPEIHPPSGNALIFFDANGNPQLISTTVNTIGFASDGTPQINGEFGIQKVVGKKTVSASVLGGVAAGQMAAISDSISGALPGDIVQWSFDNAISVSALGAMAFIGAYVPSADSFQISFVNTDPVNPSASYTANVVVQIIRP